MHFAFCILHDSSLINFFTFTYITTYMYCKLLVISVLYLRFGLCTVYHCNIFRNFLGVSKNCKSWSGLGMRINQCCNASIHLCLDTQILKLLVHLFDPLSYHLLKTSVMTLGLIITACNMSTAHILPNKAFVSMIKMSNPVLLPMGSIQFIKSTFLQGLFKW